MKIIFSKNILKKEKIDEEKFLIINAFKKGIFVRLKGEALPRSSELIKIYMTTIRGARRGVFLVDLKSKDGFFLMFRSKNDVVGKNISIKNEKFKNILVKYLQILRNDIKEKNYEVFNI